MPGQRHQGRSGLNILVGNVIAIVVRKHSPLGVGKLFEPLAGGRVIVRARVDYGVSYKIPRKVRIVFMAIEGKLQDPRSWNLELIAKFFDIRCNQAEILGDERQLS